MTRLCVAIFVRDVPEAHRDAVLAAKAGADLVEYRIDSYVAGVEGGLLEEGARVAGVSELVQRSPLPCIVTCRPTWEGGRCELPEEQRIAWLVEAARAGASYIDVELETCLRRGHLLEGLGFTYAREARQARVTVPREQRSGIIVSSHDFSGRPPRLAVTLAAMADCEADVSKIVWAARTVRDNEEALAYLHGRNRPTIALCMGEAGLMSRVLARKFGAFLTFASLEGGKGTAPGQVSIHDMKRLYRWDAIGPNTKVYGVVGSPIMHSMSPALHNAAFEAVGFDGVYLPLLVNEGYESFKAFMETFLGTRGLNLAGLSITIPHKENALRYLMEISPSSRIDKLAAYSIGAVNTIVIDRNDEGGRGPILRGFSTDYAAILDCITACLGIRREDLANYRVAVIGAGGTGRTAVAALAHYGATVVVYNRTRERADALAAEFNGKRVEGHDGLTHAGGKVVAAPMEKLCDSCCQVYLNTTSVGMYPHVDASPLGEKPPQFTADTLVFDTIYNPTRTKLLAQAEAAGAKTISGVEMFVRQAVGQFEAWTEKPAPVELMRQVIERRLVQKTRRFKPDDAVWLQKRRAVVIEVITPALALAGYEGDYMVLPEEGKGLTAAYDGELAPCEDRPVYHEDDEERLPQFPARAA